MIIHIKSKDILAFQVLLTAFVAFSNLKIVLYAAQLCCLLILIIRLSNQKFRLNCKEYFILFGAFVIWSFLSIMWATVPENSVSACISIAQAFFLGLYVMTISESAEKVDRLLKTFPFANLMMIICLFVETEYAEWSSIIHGSFTVASAEGRLGYSIGLFPNSLGEICAVFATVLYYFYIKEKQKKYLVLVLVDFILVLLTKSRTSLFFMLFCLVGMLFFYAKKAEKIKALLISVTLGMVVLWAIFNITTLYDVIGFRLEGLIGIFDSDKYITDDSTLGRIKLLQAGINIFEESPIIGVGINNYGYHAYHYYGIWTIVPAHNNYIELLADVGIVGAIFYYTLLYTSLIRGIKMLKRSIGNERAFLSVLLIILVCRVIADFFGVSYLEDFHQIMNSICIAGITCLWRKRKEKYE